MKQIILIIDDNAGDFGLIKHALRQLNIDLTVIHFTSGDKALSYLHETLSIPSFIILDQNMPDEDGWSILRKIRTSEKLKDIKVAMFSGVQIPGKDVSYFADKYLVKPSTWEDFESAIVNLAKEWLGL